MDETTELLNTRQKTHGDWDEFSQVCQDLKKICSKHSEKRTPGQNEAVDMLCNKLARVVTGDADFADHWDDIKGYAQLGKQGHTFKTCDPHCGFSELEPEVIKGYNNPRAGRAYYNSDPNDPRASRA